MATLLTFGNPLKFGLDSCHNAKGRPTFLHREREHLKLRAKHTRTSYHHREEPSNGTPRTRELLPRRVVEQGPAMTLRFPPSPLGSNRGRALTDPLQIVLIL